MEQYFKVKKLNPSVFVIQENISNIHPVYRNDPLNLYLILGEHSALLLDTGCDQHPLKPLVDRIIDSRDLVVLNSHAHWDHVLGNHQFDEVYIHKSEKHYIEQKYDISFLKDSPFESINKYRKLNYFIPTASKVSGLEDGVEFDLGNTIIKIVHLPGHSPGSICLLKDDTALFTTDVAYYGDIFLPSQNQFSLVSESLSKLMGICTKYDNLILYPSHCKTPCDRKLVNLLHRELGKIDQNWESRKFRSFFNAWEIESDHFNFIIAKSNY